MINYQKLKMTDRLLDLFYWGRVSLTRHNDINTYHAYCMYWLEWLVFPWWEYFWWSSQMTITPYIYSFVVRCCIYGELWYLVYCECGFWRSQCVCEWLWYREEGQDYGWTYKWVRQWRKKCLCKGGESEAEWNMVGCVTMCEWLWYGHRMRELTCLHIKKMIP